MLLELIKDPSERTRKVRKRKLTYWYCTQFVPIALEKHEKVDQPQKSFDQPEIYKEDVIVIDYLFLMIFVYVCTFLATRNDGCCSKFRCNS